MTRNRKVDPAVLEREYVYDTGSPPISFTALAERHEVARNTVANYGIKGGWFEKRQQFRQTLGMKVTEAMGEKSLEFAVAAREKSMVIGLKVLEKFEQQLDDPDFKIKASEMVAVAAMLRQLGVDAAANVSTDGEVLYDPDTAPLGEEFARRILDATELRGIGPGQAPPPASPEGAGED